MRCGRMPSGMASNVPDLNAPERARPEGRAYEQEAPDLKVGPTREGYGFSTESSAAWKSASGTAPFTTFITFIG